MEYYLSPQEQRYSILYFWRVSVYNSTSRTFLSYLPFMHREFFFFDQDEIVYASTFSNYNSGHIRPQIGFLNPFQAYFHDYY